jgi:hypothetical protein
MPCLLLLLAKWIAKQSDSGLSFYLHSGLCVTVRPSLCCMVSSVLIGINYDVMNC